MATDIFYSFLTTNSFNSGVCSTPDEIIRTKVGDISIFDFIFGKVDKILLSNNDQNKFYKLRITTNDGDHFDFISSDERKLKTIISFFPE